MKSTAPTILVRRTVQDFEATEYVVDGASVLQVHHHDYASFAVLFLGAYSIREGRNSTRVSAPMAAYFPPGVERTVAFPSGTSQFLWVKLPDRLVGDLPLAAAEPGGFFPFSESRTQWLGTRLVIEMRRTDRASGYLLHGMLLELFGRFVRSLSDEEIRQPVWLATAMSALQRPEKPLRITDIAGECGLHPTHFTRAFKKWVGCTPQDYSRLQRVFQARLSLATTATPLVEIADECGFSDQAHFTREFRRFVGSTPARFRRELAVAGAASRR